MRVGQREGGGGRGATSEETQKTVQKIEGDGVEGRDETGIEMELAILQW